MTEEGGVRVMRGCEPRRVETQGGAGDGMKTVTWYDSLQERNCKVSRKAGVYPTKDPIKLGQPLY